MSQIFESLRMRVENENESSHNKIESRDWEWDESFPWESQFWDRDESLAEVCSLTIVFVRYVPSKLWDSGAFLQNYFIAFIGDNWATIYHSFPLFAGTHDVTLKSSLTRFWSIVWEWNSINTPIYFMFN